MQVTRTRTRTGHATRRRTAALAAAALAATALVATTGAPSAVAAPKRADLVVTKVGSVPEKVRYTTRFSMGARIANQGKAPAGAGQVSFLFSKDKVRSADDELGGTAATKRQRPGKVSTVAASVRAPMEGGRYWVIVCADAKGKVRESNERNNCSVSKTQVEVDAALKAQLTGDLTFTDQGSKDEGWRTETWQRSASVSLKLLFDGEVLEGTFADDGSTYDRVGTRDVLEQEPDCTRTRDFDEAGEGGFAYTGDASKDDLYGWFTRSDMSRLRIGLFMRADWSEVRTSTGHGEWPCESSSETSTGTNREVLSVELEQVDISADHIVYEITGWEGAYGTASDFEAASGRLTLTLR